MVRLHKFADVQAWLRTHGGPAEVLVATLCLGCLVRVALELIRIR